MKKLLSVLLAVALIACFIPTVFVSAAGDVTVYLSSTGDDANDGKSAAKPVKTFAAAAALATADNSSLTILVLPGSSYDLAAATDLPVFACPTTIKSADTTDMATIRCSARVQVSGDVTFDYMILEAAAAQMFEPLDGTSLTIGANCDVVNAGQRPSLYSMGNKITDITVCTGEWFYIYSVGSISVLGDASVSIVSPGNHDVENGVVEEVNILIDTDGVIDQVFGSGMPGQSVIKNVNITVIKGQIAKFYAGAHGQTSGGVVSDRCQNSKVEAGVINICGGTFLGDFSFEGTNRDKYSDGTYYNVYPEKLELHIYGEAGKAAYEAISTKIGTEPTPVYHTEDKPAEKPKEEVKEDEKPTEGDKTEEGGSSAETGDSMVFVAIMAVVSLAGVVLVRKNSAK